MTDSTVQRIYVAGPMTSPFFDRYLYNIRKGLDFCAKLRRAGFSPMPFWPDFIEILCNPDTVDCERLQKTNFPWLACAHVVVVLPCWEESAGTQKEISFSRENGIPIYYRDDFDSDEALIDLLIQLRSNKCQTGNASAETIDSD